MHLYVMILYTNIRLLISACTFVILQPTAAHQDILVYLVISHVHPVPLAVIVLEVVLDYVLSKTVTMFSDVKQIPLLYLKQPIQVWYNLIDEFSLD